MAMRKYIRDIHSRLIDSTTGEVLRSIATVEADRYSYYNPDRGYKFRGRSGKLIRYGSDNPFPASLTMADIGRLTILAGHIHYSAGVLISTVTKAERRSIVPITKKGIVKAVGLAERQGNSFVNKMLKAKVLRMIEISVENGEDGDAKPKKEQQWYINPLYFSPVYLNKTMFFLWEDQIGDYIPPWVKDIYYAERYSSG